MVKVIRVVRVGLEVRLVRMVGVGRVDGLEAMLLEIGCGQKDPQRGEAGNPQFHIFRCTSISWIHVGESVTQSFTFLRFLAMFSAILGSSLAYLGHNIGIFLAYY